ncbi:DUF1015 domain-containing protein [Fusobacterium sp. PH5-44]
MAIVKAFNGIRPRLDLGEKIAALPYDVYNTKEAMEIVKKNPYSFLRIDRAETTFDNPLEIDIHSTEVYKAAHDTLWEMINNGEFIEDANPCYYIYELIMNGRSQTGIVGCSSVDDYLNNIVKKHENTLKVKEQDRINHINICNAQTGPIFLAYSNNESINKIVNKIKEKVPVYDFISEDEITHRVWIVNDINDVLEIYEGFKNVACTYIADGHHRAASAVNVALKKRKENKLHTGKEEYNFFLSVLFPHNQLKIMDYNRVVKDLNGLTEEQFLDKMKEKFEIELCGKNQYKPLLKGNLGMYLGNNWYKLKIRENYIPNDPVESLDVAILQNEVLSPILAIDDPKTNKRIDFVGGIRGLSELERRVSEDMTVAFAMYPTDIKELFQVADAGLLMPPKSTWFEPKLRSGLFIHKI